MSPCCKCKYWEQVDETPTGRCHCWPPWSALDRGPAAALDAAEFYRHPLTADTDYCGNYAET
jgi:hypothetical protein